MCAARISFQCISRVLRRNGPKRKDKGRLLSSKSYPMITYSQCVIFHLPVRRLEPLVVCGPYASGTYGSLFVRNKSNQYLHKRIEEGVLYNEIKKQKGKGK